METYITVLKLLLMHYIFDIGNLLKLLKYYCSYVPYISRIKCYVEMMFTDVHTMV
jgi:hypothetical protein